MNRKLHRVLDEIQKTEDKIAAWQEHLDELNTQRELLENAEIIKSVRSMKLGSRELLAVLEGVQDGTVILSEKQGTGGNPEGDGNTESLNWTETAGYEAEELTVENRMPEDTALESEDLNESEN